MQQIQRIEISLLMAFSFSFLVPTQSLWKGDNNFSALAATAVTQQTTFDWKTFDPARFSGSDKNLVPPSGSKYKVPPSFPNDPSVNGLVSVNVRNESLPVIVFAHEGTRLLLSKGRNQLVSLSAPAAGSVQNLVRGNGLPSCTVYGTTDYTPINYGSNKLSKLIDGSKFALFGDPFSKGAAPFHYWDLNRMFFKAAAVRGQLAYPRLILLRPNEALRIFEASGKNDRFIKAPATFDSTWQVIVDMLDSSNKAHKVTVKQLEPNPITPGRITGTDQGLAIFGYAFEKAVAERQAGTGNTNQTGSGNQSGGEPPAGGNQPSSGNQPSAGTNRPGTSNAAANRAALQKAAADWEAAQNLAPNLAALAAANAAAEQAAADKAAADKAAAEQAAANKAAAEKAAAEKAAAEAAAAQNASAAEITAKLAAADSAAAAGSPNLSNQSGLMTITEARSYMLDLINKDRAAHGVKPVALDEIASIAGQLHTNEESANNYMGHWNMAGKKPPQRYTEVGGTAYVAENGSGMRSEVRTAVPQVFKKDFIDYQEAQMMSEVAPNDGHKRNILDPAHTHIGIGLTSNVNSWGSVSYPHLTHEFLNNHAKFSPTPLTVSKGGTFNVAGTLNSGCTLYSIDFWMEPLPKPMTPSEINATHSYGIGDKYITSIFPSYPNTVGTFKTWQGPNFDCQIKVPTSWQSGLYYILIWAKVPGLSGYVPISLRTISINS